MPSITDALRARGIGSGQGISQTDLTALIDVTNAAEANNDAIKLDVVNKLNALNPALNLTTAASWSTIRAAIASMQYRGAQTITPGPADIPIPAGYHNGSGKVSGVSVPVANVLAGTTIAGQTGTMTNRGAVTITPGPVDQSIPAGYHNGAGKVFGVPVPTQFLVEGNTVANQGGTLKDYSRQRLTDIGTTYIDAKSTKSAQGIVIVEPQTGYYTEGLNASGYGSIRLTESNLIPANILSGKSIFGVAGTAKQAPTYTVLHMAKTPPNGDNQTNGIAATVKNISFDITSDVDNMGGVLNNSDGLGGFNFSNNKPTYSSSAWFSSRDPINLTGAQFLVMNWRAYFTLNPAGSEVSVAVNLGSTKGGGAYSGMQWTHQSVGGWQDERSLILDLSKLPSGTTSAYLNVKLGILSYSSNTSSIANIWYSSILLA